MRGGLASAQCWGAPVSPTHLASLYRRRAALGAEIAKVDAEIAAEFDGEVAPSELPAANDTRGARPPRPRGTRGPRPPRLGAVEVTDTDRRAGAKAAASRGMLRDGGRR